MNKLNNKLLWYLATTCGFTIGLVIGMLFGDYYDTVSMRKINLFFWAFPATGAGFGMAFAQWLLIRNVHKNSYLWIIATTIGVNIIGGGAMLILVVANYYRTGTLPWLFSRLPGWFVPLTVITPIIIFTGPFLQWLIMRHVTKHQSFKELLKLSAGWIFTIITLFVMFGVLGALIQSRNEILNYITGIAATIPSGLIFAYITMDISSIQNEG